MGDIWPKKQEKEYPTNLEPFNERLAQVKTFLKEYNHIERAVISEIFNPYSYAVKGEHASEIDSIIVSKEKKVKKRARKLNALRSEQNLPALKILEIPLLQTPTGEPFSSTQIRKDKKTIKANNEKKSIFKKVKLPEKLKPEIRRTKGQLAESVKDLPPPPKHVISIGDKVTNSLIREEYPVSIAIIDQKVERKPVSPSKLVYRGKNNETEAPPCLPCKNPPGMLTQDAWTCLKISFFQKKPVIIRVYGEEDLIGIPATILAPNDTLIMYGQPPIIGKEGIAYYHVNDEKRNHAIKILKRMNAFNDST